MKKKVLEIKCVNVLLDMFIHFYHTEAIGHFHQCSQVVPGIGLREGKDKDAFSTKWHTVANKLVWPAKSLTNLHQGPIGSTKQYEGLKAADIWLYLIHKKKISQCCSTTFCLLWAVEYARDSQT